MSERPPATAEPDLDAFMRTDVQEGRRVSGISFPRALLTLTVVLALGWLSVEWTDEVSFHFADDAITDLGTPEAVSARGMPDVGTYARIEGVLGNKAATVNGLRPGSLRVGPVQVRQLLGSHVFVEFDQDTLYERYQPFTRITVEGRITDFGPRSDLVRVREYFNRRFAMDIPDDARLLIVGEAPGKLWKYLVALSLSVAVALMSVYFLIRSGRVRVVEDEIAS